MGKSRSGEGNAFLCFLFTLVLIDDTLVLIDDCFCRGANVFKLRGEGFALGVLVLARAEVAKQARTITQIVNL